MDPLVRRVEVEHELLCADDEDDVVGTPGVRRQLATQRRRDHESSVARDRMDAAEGELGLDHDRLDLPHVGCAVERLALDSR